MIQCLCKNTECAFLEQIVVQCVSDILILCLINIKVRRSSSAPKLFVSRRCLNYFCSHLMKPWDLLIAGGIVFAVRCKQQEKEKIKKIPKTPETHRDVIEGGRFYIMCRHTHSTSNVSEWKVTAADNVGLLFSGGIIPSIINYMDSINSSFHQYNMKGFAATTLYKNNSFYILFSAGWLEMSSR